MIGTLLAEKGRTICLIDQSKLFPRPIPIALFIYPIPMPHSPLPIAHCPIPHCPIPNEMGSLSHTGTVHAVST